MKLEKFSGTDKAPRAYHKLTLFMKMRISFWINKTVRCFPQPEMMAPVTGEYLTGYLLKLKPYRGVI